MRHSLPLLLAAALVPAAEDGAELFRTTVAPILSASCVRCHGPDKQKAELRVDSREALLKGGEDGVVLVAGKPDESLLVKAIRRQKGAEAMPPKAENALAKDKVEAIAKWIALGAPWPDGVKVAAPAAK